MADLHLFDPVRIVWLDSYCPGEAKWARPDDLEVELDSGYPTHETVGLWFGEHSGCACVVQSRGAAEEFTRLDAPLAIPLACVLLLEAL